MSLAPALLAGALVVAPRVGADERQPMAVLVGKVLTVDGGDHVYAPGMLLVEDGVLRYVGPPGEVPEGYQRLEFPDAWAMPGMVDLHTHIHAGTDFRDINDMVQAVNPELRVTPTVRPANRFVRLACVSGVTTLFGIPGSGTNISGFGVLYKSKSDPSYEHIVLADPGGMKVAQDSNPQRRADFGATRAGMGWILENIAHRAIAARKQGRRDPALDSLGRVLAKELPVLIHTAGSEGVVNTARMWRETFETRSVLSHGSFDGWRSARAVAALGMPVNHGPRTVDYYSSLDGLVHGTAAEYAASGSPNFSLNTDSPVIPEEELFLQGAMGARYGGDPYEMLRALTIHPARAFGIDARVGSLEVGKDADIVIRTGDPLDPRSVVELVLIEGQVEYRRSEGRQVF